MLECFGAFAEVGVEYAVEGNFPLWCELFHLGIGDAFDVGFEDIEEFVEVGQAVANEAARGGHGFFGDYSVAADDLEGVVA